MVILEVIIIVLLLTIIAGIVLIFFRWNEFARRYVRFDFPPFRHMPPWLRHSRGDAYYFPLLEIIDSAEKRAEITLSWGAREMLIIPVVESIESRKELNWRDVEHSIRDVVATVAEEHDSEHLPRRERDSVSIIRAFHKRFCNIPPFCARTED